jgi:lipopolysaccharide biosynthesis regulator YciM
MPTESAFLLAGLLFVAAALGYFFARFGEQDDEQVTPDQLSADYLKGLNYVLNEEPDRAVELFTRMAELDEEALETHFALGSLFRKRGEVDRAIRVHQNLMARPSLSRAQKDQAEAALAEDYLSAGLFDRAEKMFEKLVTSPDFREQALTRLIRIYEVTKEWTQAIDIHSQLEKVGAKDLDAGQGASPVAHYYCELAEIARSARDFTAARDMLKHADAVRNGTVRSIFIQADIAHDSAHEKDAIRLYKKVAANKPDLLVEVIPKLAASCRAAESDGELSKFLRKVLDKDSEQIGAVAMAAVRDLSIDDPVMLDALSQFIAGDGTLSELIDIDRLEHADGTQRTEILDRVRAALKRIVGSRPAYHCDQCGYGSLILQWQCPGCRAWETVKPEIRINLVPSY